MRERLEIDVLAENAEMQEEFVEWQWKMRRAVVRAICCVVLFIAGMAWWFLWLGQDEVSAYPERAHSGEMEVGR